MVGQGYVGLPVAMRAIEVGFTVVGFDSSVERVKSLQSATSYVGDISRRRTRSCAGERVRADVAIPPTSPGSTSP